MYQQYFSIQTPSVIKEFTFIIYLFLCTYIYFYTQTGHILGPTKLVSWQAVGFFSCRIFKHNGTAHCKFHFSRPLFRSKPFQYEELQQIRRSQTPSTHEHETFFPLISSPPLIFLNFVPIFSFTHRLLFSRNF